MRHGEPAAAIHEIVRQKIDHLKLASASEHLHRLLIGEGLLDAVYAAYIMQDVKRSYLEKAAKMGRLPEFIEYSHFGISLALLAGEMGISYLPSRCHLGSDLLKHNPNIKVSQDPLPKCCLRHQSSGSRYRNHSCTKVCDSGECPKVGSMGMDAEALTPVGRLLSPPKR
jgi:acyl CoA:acetate/3-ketoacid CoA transferase alpha subunit